MSEEEVAADARARPWLATLEGCMIKNPECVRFPKPEYTGYFLDTTEGAASNETRCLQRAAEFHAWCGNTMTNRTAAVYLASAAIEVYPPFGCAVYQRGCPAVGEKVKGGEAAQLLEGVFFDDHHDSFMNETRCLQRAVDFRVYCHPPESPEAVAALYAPTAKHFVVALLDDGSGDKAAEKDKDGGDAGADAGAEGPFAAAGGSKAVHLSTHARALWGVSRKPPSFASQAVPLALFELAGEYLDCRSPPLPAAFLEAGKKGERGGVGKYHCNGPQALLAVEALSLYLQVRPGHADAHYNRGVAFYTLGDLDNAVPCFVSCLKLEPAHSIAMGALATVLTQQGRFAHAWGLLDARIRPPPTAIATASLDNAQRTKKKMHVVAAVEPPPPPPPPPPPEAAAAAAAAKSVTSSTEEEHAKPKLTLSSLISFFGFGKVKAPAKQEEEQKAAALVVPQVSATAEASATATTAAKAAAAAAAAAVTVAPTVTAAAAVTAAFVPNGVSAPELVAWARLAPRFGETKAAIALLRGFLASMKEQEQQEQEQRMQQKEAEEEGDDDGDEEQRHDNAGAAALGQSDAPAAPQAQTQAPQDRMAGTNVRKHLEASMRFRLAWLLDKELELLLPFSRQLKNESTTTTTTASPATANAVGAAAAASVVAASVAWEEQTTANALVAQLALDADNAAIAAAAAAAASRNSVGAGSATAVGAQAAAAQSPNPVGISTGAALAQTAALRMAFCRKCVRREIPAAEAWRSIPLKQGTLLSPAPSALVPPAATPSLEETAAGATLKQSSTVPSAVPSRVRPVFVVGLPRSGTSLIEQMLGQHPLVAMAGEVPNLAVLTPKIFVERGGGKGSTRMTKAVFDPSVTAHDMNLIAERFMRELAHHADLSMPPAEPAAAATTGGGGPQAGAPLKTQKEPLLLVSKLPNHFELLGFIAKLFPGCKIIHATRDVRDTLLSNYQMHYQSGHRWSYNLTEAVEYASGYRAIMRHWTEDVFNQDLADDDDGEDEDDKDEGGSSGGGGGRGLPEGAELNMLEVRYEDLVCDPANMARSLARFLEVEYVEGMAAPHASGRTTQTASNEQVRRPVYTTSVGRWRNYAITASPHGDGPAAAGAAAAAAAAAAAVSDEFEFEEEEGEEEEEEDLEALAVRLGGFPADEVLKRVLKYEPHPAHPATIRDLVRDLPCSGSSSSSSSGGQSTAQQQQQQQQQQHPGNEARWPGGTAGAFRRA